MSRYNISICKKNLKDETSKRIVRPMQVNRNRFHEFSLDVSSLIITTSAFVKKERSKMSHLKKFVKPMEIKQDPKIPHRYSHIILPVWIKAAEFFV